MQVASHLYKHPTASYLDASWSFSIHSVMNKEQREKTRSLCEPIVKGEDADRFIGDIAYNKGML